MNTIPGGEKCLLFYNDYGIVNDNSNPYTGTAKRDGIYDYFANLLQTKTVEEFPIDGIGMQCHVEVRPSYMMAKDSFKKMAGLTRSDGQPLLIHLSELDALINNPEFTGGTYYTKWWQGSINPNFWEPDFAQGKSFNMIACAYLDEVRQAQRFGISTWGITDRYSMTGVNYHNQKDWPVLFTKANAPKSAYQGLLEALLGINWERMETGNDGGSNYGWDWRWNNPGGFAEPLQSYPNP